MSTTVIHIQYLGSQLFRSYATISCYFFFTCKDYKLISHNSSKPVCLHLALHILFPLYMENDILTLAATEMLYKVQCSFSLEKTKG